jgi:hypothetical protein
VEGVSRASIGFVDDMTIPDDTIVPAAGAFTKTWRLFNNGTRAWGEGYRFAFVQGSVDGKPVGGDPLGGPGSVPVAATAPGASIDISVDFIVPSTPGTVRSDWRLRAPSGQAFGDQVFVRVIVPE